MVNGFKQFLLSPTGLSNSEHRCRQGRFIAPKYIGIERVIKEFNLAVILGCENVSAQLPIDINGVREVQFDLTDLCPPFL